MIDEKEKLELEIEKLKLENENLKLSKKLSKEDMIEAIDEGNSKTATKFINGYLIYGIIAIIAIWTYTHFVKI